MGGELAVHGAKSITCWPSTTAQGLELAGGPSWLTSLGYSKDNLWSEDPFRCELLILKTHRIILGNAGILCVAESLHLNLNCKADVEARVVRIAITGAGGNLGTKLRCHLQDRYELVLLSRTSGGGPAIHAFDLSAWNTAWVNLLANVDVVVHFAANPSPVASWPELISANIDMVLNVYEACASMGVSRLIFASSNHVMSGYRKGSIPVLRSDTPPCPGNPYGATKLIGERIGKSFSERHGISSINVRIGWNRREKDNRPSPEMGDWGRRMWLSDRDFCALMEGCIKAPASLRWAVINGVSNNSGSNWDLTEAREHVGYQPVDDAFDDKWP